MTTDTPTLTIWNATTNKWEVHVSKKEQARRAAVKEASASLWASILAVTA
jgi:hypothetical protein